MNSISLTRKLLSFNTVNPPGNEKECALFVTDFLQDIGFMVKSYEFAPGRPTLIARMPGAAAENAICFTGHLDVVPLGNAPWTKDPFAGETDGDKLFGRGTSDMKSGVAAMLMMAKNLAAHKPLLNTLVFIFTSGEETCSQGAYHVAGMKEVMGKAAAMVVGEPTSNIPVIGHKGCVRFTITTRGKTAHASMPELGDNAIYKAADVIKKLQVFDFKTPSHPLLGTPTLVVSQIQGGININSVPDQAVMGIDIRTIPDQDHRQIQSSIQQLPGLDIDVRLLEEVNSVATDPDNKWIQAVYGITENILGEKPSNSSVKYFTDASVLKPAFGNPPCIILGPGEAGQAHQTDEFCYISKIDQAMEIYLEIVRKGIIPRE